MMSRRILLALVLSCPLVTACFQTIDNGVTSGPLFSTDGPSSDAGAGGTGLPGAFGSVDPSQQCEAGSALCYELCLSPECATTIDAAGGNVILPPTLQTPTVVLPDGATSADSCADLEAQSMLIRERSCSGCHGPPPALGPVGFNYVLDDTKLVGGTASTGQTMVIAGDPVDSYVWQRMNAHLSNASSRLAMPPTPCSAGGGSPAVCNALVYPTAEDVSLMYAWIANCAGDADGGAFSSSYYGGDYGPGGDSGSPSSDAGAHVTDAGGQ